MREQDMDDVALLRQTIRRCTAILVVIITITEMQGECLTL
jgi:hypothetical protein